MSIDVKADCQLIVFQIPRLEYGALKRYAEAHRQTSIELAIRTALRRATEHIGLSSQDYEQIVEEMRNAKRNRK